MRQEPKEALIHRTCMNPADTNDRRCSNFNANSQEFTRALQASCSNENTRDCYEERFVRRPSEEKPLTYSKWRYTDDRNRLGHTDLPLSGTFRSASKLVLFRQKEHPNLGMENRAPRVRFAILFLIRP